MGRSRATIGSAHYLAITIRLNGSVTLAPRYLVFRLLHLTPPKALKRHSTECFRGNISEESHLRTPQPHPFPLFPGRQELHASPDKRLLNSAKRAKSRIHLAFFHPSDSIQRDSRLVADTSPITPGCTKAAAPC